MEVATEPMVLAIWLAAQGSVAAPAAGVSKPAVSTPPNALTANVPNKARRNERGRLDMVDMGHSFTVTDALPVNER
ncbi:Other/FunK1 protein kinase [Mycolicibacterium canariasense]|uniref:Other/FunK1 protein kinase n=1 Tax=Mycolicibacterium canariasense TaxID=228230 RepID=A0A124E3E5_MYCCR|nr:Other/FunK1 protein kinase [Mycolicibacterium canariasense]